MASDVRGVRSVVNDATPQLSPQPSTVNQQCDQRSLSWSCRSLCWRPVGHAPSPIGESDKRADARSAAQVRDHRDIFVRYSPPVPQIFAPSLGLALALVALLSACSSSSSTDSPYQVPVSEAPTQAPQPTVEPQTAVVPRQGGQFHGTNSARTQRLSMSGSYRVDWTVSGDCIFHLYSESSIDAPGQINTQVATNAYELAGGSVGRQGAASPVGNTSYVYALPEAQYNAFANTTTLDRCDWSFTLTPEG